MTSRTIRSSTPRLTAGLAATLLLGAAARADVFNVNTFDDHNDGSCELDCTLREAVILSTGTDGPDEILLDAGVYLLTIPGDEASALAGDLDVNYGEVTISGQGMGVTIIDGNDLDRVFQVSSLSTATLILRDLTVRGGFLPLFPGGGIGVGGSGTLIMERVEVTDCQAPDDGAALNIAGTAYLYDSHIHGNSCTAPWGNGGGLYVTAVNSPGTVVAERCTFSGNHAPNGGSACFANFYSDVTFNNCTLSHNSPNSGILTNYSTVHLNDSTVTSNAIYGVYNINGTVHAKNTLIGNHNNFDVFGSLVSGGYNLLSTTAGVTVVGDATGNIYNVNPLIGPLQHNGGLTPTRELLEGSPAIDASDPVDYATTDQRGLARPTDGDGNGTFLPDIGAYEAGFLITDCNGNGIDDGVDIDGGFSTDCNGNEIPDECDIAGGMPDCNGNGLPDGCDPDLDRSGVPDDCEDEGDFDGDGVTGPADLAAVLTNWGSCPTPCPFDIDGDGVVGSADLAILLGNWG